MIQIGREEGKSLRIVEQVAFSFCTSLLDKEVLPAHNMNEHSFREEGHGC